MTQSTTTPTQTSSRLLSSKLPSFRPIAGDSNGNHSDSQRTLGIYSTADNLNNQSMSSSAISGKYSTLESERQKDLAKKRNLRNFSKELRQRALARAARKAEEKLSCQSPVDRSIAQERRPSAHFHLSQFVKAARHPTGLLDASKHSLVSIGSLSSHFSASETGIAGDLKPAGEALAAQIDIEEIVNAMKADEVEVSNLCKIFSEFDTNQNGELGLEDFCRAFSVIDEKVSREELIKLFVEADFDDSGTVDFDEFLRLTTTPHLKLQALKQKNIRDHVGLVQVEPTTGPFFDG